MYRNIKIHTMKKALALLPVMLPVILVAQNETAKAFPLAAERSDMVWYGLYTVMGVLLVVIMVLSNVLLSMVRITIEKSKVKTATILLLLMLSGRLFSQEAQATAGVAGSGLGGDWNMIMALTVLGTEIFVVLVLILRINAMVNALAPQRVIEPKPVRQIVLPKFMDKLNASVAVEKEKDILLDHNYDGIRELNNDLPPWWKYSFIISIFWAMGYLMYYHVLGGPSSHDEYVVAMTVAKEQQEAYARLNAGKVDENTVTLADAAGIEDGKSIFTTNCSPCHGQHGEGIVGPNLTDNYWLHGGSLSDVFKSIKNGWPAKGMKSWQFDLSAVQIKDVASYVKSLAGTNPPNAKAPQGDLYTEPGLGKPVNGSVAASDSTKVKGI